MPIYEYTCLACNRDFEVLTSISGADDVRCPECGGEVKRKMSLFGFSAGKGFVSSSGNAGCGTCAKTSCHHCH